MDYDLIRQRHQEVSPHFTSRSTAFPATNDLSAEVIKLAERISQRVPQLRQLYEQAQSKSAIIEGYLSPVFYELGEGFAGLCKLILGDPVLKQLKLDDQKILEFWRENQSYLSPTHRQRLQKLVTGGVPDDKKESAILASFQTCLHKLYEVFNYSFSKEEIKSVFGWLGLEEAQKVATQNHLNYQLRLEKISELVSYHLPLNELQLVDLSKDLLNIMTRCSKDTIDQFYQSLFHFLQLQQVEIVQSE